MNQRIKKLRAKFQELGIDAFLVTNPVKVRYLTGFSGDTGACLITLEDSYFISDPRFTEQAEQEVQESRIIIEGKVIPVIIAEKKLLAEAKRVGLEGDGLGEEYCLLCDCCPKTSFVWVKRVVEEIAAIKDAEEIKKIQKAIELTEYVFERHILPQIRPGIPGITENDLASEIVRWGKKYGAEKNAFEPFDVASGAHSSLPHAESSSNELKEGDTVQFDFGYVFDGYCSDFSRVVFLGEPTEKQREIYNIVLNAQETAIRAARPGMKCKDLDKIARDCIESGGYDLPHSLGHGLGIMPHSAPRIGLEEEAELEPGWVTTIEPGIYIPKWGGIRLEDVIVITKDGCQNLTKSLKEIRVV